MTRKENIQRDYSLIGTEAEEAVRKGLADAEWYQSPVSKDDMKKLLVRKNWPGIRDTLLWFGLIIGSGIMVYIWWGTWYVVFPYIIYSVLYASTSDSRWHESSHGTAFKSDWLNILLYEIASFMVLRQSTVWRWSHTRHHSDTIIRGRDPEIAIPRPPNIRKALLVFVGISSSIPEFKKLILHARGKIDPQVATYVPISDYNKVFWKARIYLAIFLTVIALSLIFQTILPLMYIGLPTLLGSWLMPVYGFTQHAGLQENVLDHRLNCRTVYMNRIHRFLYWNMNYHVEHHMYPLVPYHALPRLHELMKDDCPKPYKNIIEAYKEIIPTIFKQVKDPTYYAERKLPASAQPVPEQPDYFIGDKANVKDGKIAVCNAKLLPEGEVVRFDFDQHTFAIYHTADNYYASDGMCTHGNSHLAGGMIIGDQIECPKHNGRFNLADGSPKRLPACVGLSTYEVVCGDGIIYLNIEPLLNKNEPYGQETITAKVVSNENVATFIKELVLEIPDTDSFRYSPGQFVQFVIPPYESTYKEISVQDKFLNTWKNQDLFNLNVSNSVYIRRNYSMATNPDTNKQLKFNIRISLPPKNSDVNPGVGSSFLFCLKAGDEVKIGPSQGNFLIKETAREMVYIGGGAGMAPLKSHISWLFETVKTKRKVSFWYGARTRSDLFYQEYFQGLAQRLENFNFQAALSEPDKQDKWTGELGFIHEVALRNYLQDHKNLTEVEFYLCGPPALIQATQNMLKNLDISDKLIAFDEFD